MHGPIFKAVINYLSRCESVAYSDLMLFKGLCLADGSLNTFTTKYIIVFYAVSGNLCFHIKW